MPRTKPGTHDAARAASPGIVLRFLLVVLLAGCLGGPDAVHAEDRFEAARRVYEERRTRPSFWKRTEGRRILAATGDARCIAPLARDYGSAEAPHEEVRHTIVSTVFTRPWRGDALEAIRAWRDASTKPRDAWLWYRSMQLEARSGSTQRLRTALDETTEPVLHEATFRALASRDGAAALERIPARLAPLKDSAFRWKRGQSATLEWTARSLAVTKALKDTEAWKAAARAVLTHFESRSLPRRTKFVIARCLSHALGGDPTQLEKDAWIREILAGGSGAATSDKRYAGPRFGGLEGTGERIVYVIDFSDSMLTPIDEALKRRLRKVVTGPTDPRSKKARELPWNRIENRFDLAREMLKASLLELGKDKLFAVVWFGTETGTLAATPKLMKVKRKTIKRVVEELDGIEPGAVGAAGTQFELGSLRGMTNLHGGLRLAMKLTAKDRFVEDAYVDPEARWQGAETIFLLSDGTPSWDDWPQIDKPDDRPVVTDRETMKPSQASEINFEGPYGGYWPAYIPDDIERRNLFRSVEIHCIGIGEANMELLRSIADAGLGKAIQMGKDVK